MKIAILGTGLMGSGLAQGLINTGHETIVYNRTASKTAPLVALGAKAVLTAEEAIDTADATIIVLGDGAAVRHILFSDAVKAVLKGKKILNAATTSPDEIEAFAKEVAQHGGNLSEMSILVGAEQLCEKQGKFLLGSDAEHVEYWSGILNSIGEAYAVGEVGNASKAESPMLFGSLFISLTVAYSAAIAIKLNIPHEIIAQQLEMMVPGSSYALAGIFARDYSQVMASVDSFKTVAETAISTAKTLGMPLASLEGALELYNQAAKEGFGAQDGSSIVEVLLNSRK